MTGIDQIDLKDKSILIRLDLNVGLDKDCQILDDFRLRQAIPTLKYLKDNDANKIIIISHLGRPIDPIDWNNNPLSLRPIAFKLGSLINEPVNFIGDNLDVDLEAVRQKISELPNGSYIMLENIRFYKGEGDNDELFAKELSSLGDIYVNEAFSVSHRKAASVCAISKFLPSYAGSLLQKEITHLDKLLNSFSRPLIAVLGGAKISDKLPLIEKYLSIADKILVGGALANTILKAQGYNIGQSLFEPEMTSVSKTLGENSNKLILPNDFVVLNNNQVFTRKLLEISDNDSILDIGPETITEFVNILNQAKSIFWNGPMGKMEDERFRLGSQKLVEAIYSFNVFTVIGGGETAATLNMSGIDLISKPNVFVSTGGGAMLEYLSKKELPGISALN